MLDYPERPRRRRRRAIVVLTLATVGVLAYILVGSLRTERRILTAYVDAARAVGVAHADNAGDFRNLAVRLDTVARPAFTASITDIRSALDESLDELAGVDVPDNAAIHYALLTVAVRSWKEGIELFYESALGRADRPEDAVTSEAGIEQALAALQVGDRAYGQSLEELDDVVAGEDQDISDFPAVEYRTVDLTAPALIARVAGSQNLALVRDLAVASVSIDPRILGSRDDGFGIRPFAETLAVQVTAINLGNEPEADIEVEVRLTSIQPGAGALDEVSVEGLSAGASTSLDFTYDVRPDVEYALEVSVSRAQDDADPANNTYIERFVVNPES